MLWQWVFWMGWCEAENVIARRGGRRLRCTVNKSPTEVSSYNETEAASSTSCE